MGFEAAIFDYVGVLVEMNRSGAEAFFRHRVPLPLRDLVRRWEMWCTDHIDDVTSAPEAWLRFWGALSAEVEIPEPARAEILAFDYLALFHACPDTLPALADARRRGLRLGVLSNSALPRMEAPSAPLVLEDLVDVICVPQRNGHYKPAPASYVNVARRLGVEPERCLFFDNEPSLVDGARRAGMCAYLVDRSRREHALAEGVVRDLSAIAILTEAPPASTWQEH